MRSRLLLPLLLLPACAADPTSSREAPVIGGEITPQGEFPSVGALWLGDGIECTGTLIRPDVVLTAGHCVEPKFVGSEVPGFTLDNDTLSAPPTVVAGDHMVQHPMFDINVEMQPGLQQFWDVGLLFLAEPITSTPPMEMATPTEAAGFAVNQELAIVGYGRTSDATFDYGVKYDAIANLYSWNDSEIQIGNGGTTPQNCNGDSGGPAIADFGGGARLVGIVSRSFTLDGDCAHGGIDTRVDYYRQWVLDQLDGTPPLPPDAGVPDPDAAEPEPQADAGEVPVEGEGGGCCSTTHGSTGGSILLAAAMLGALRRRRRR
jgi:uncharacterized protein (TIGR03382 family)